jgi:hypothetical protein
VARIRSAIVAAARFEKWRTSVHQPALPTSGLLAEMFSRGARLRPRARQKERVNNLSQLNTSRKQKLGAIGVAAVAVTGMAGAWVGTASAAIPSATGKVYGCYGPKAGDLHVYKLGHRSVNCRAGWKSVVWDVKGAKGAKGSRGATGATGARGTHGTAGVHGTHGTEGANGVRGASGAQGAQGAPGSQGVAGAQGGSGAQGAQGAQGAVGAQGAQGFQGATGSQGASGTQGATGTFGTVVDVGASGAVSTATCPLGDEAAGGGWNGGNTAQTSFPVGGSPTSAPTGWQASSSAVGGVVAYVVCAPGAPVG